MSPQGIWCFMAAFPQRLCQFSIFVSSVNFAHNWLVLKQYQTHLIRCHIFTHIVWLPAVGPFHIQLSVAAERRSFNVINLLVRNWFHFDNYKSQIMCQVWGRLIHVMSWGHTSSSFKEKQLQALNTLFMSVILFLLVMVCVCTAARLGEGTSRESGRTDRRGVRQRGGDMMAWGKVSEEDREV